jgi:hypothetical protein
MTGKSLATVVVLVSFVALTAKSSAAQAAENGSRKSAGRVFTIRYGFTDEEEDAVKARARECIWENWRRARMAYCAVVWSNLEGEPTTHNFYVNRGAGGRLQVFLEIEYRCCWHSGMQGTEPRTESMGTGAYRIVERIDIKSKRVVPDDADRRPHTYVLRFKADASVKDEAASIRFL